MKIRSVLGLVAGAFLILSAGAHSMLGWKAQREALAQTNAPADLVQGLQIGWMFGGPVMLVLGIICIDVFRRRFRGEPASTFAPVLIAMVYLAFGAWATVITGGDPHFMVFILPAVLLAIASIP